MDLCIVLLVLVKHLARQLQLPLLLPKPAPHQHLESSHLQLSQLELVYVHQQYGLPALVVCLDVSLVVHNPLLLHLELPARHFSHDLLPGPEGV